MKKALWVVVAVVMLAGCSMETTTNPITEKPSSLLTVSPTIFAIVSTSANAVNLSTLEPTLDEQDLSTPFPSTTTQHEYSYLWSVDAGEMEGRRLSDVAVSDGRFVYYLDNVEYKSGKDDYRYDYYTIIKKYDARTGKNKVLLSTKGKGFVFKLLIDSNGTLYYVMAENIAPDVPMQLYRFQSGKSILLQKDVSSVVRLINNMLYYTHDEYGDDIVVKCYSLDLLTNSKTAVTQGIMGYIEFSPGTKVSCLVNETGTKFSISEDKTILQAFQIKERVTDVRETLLLNNLLYIIDHAEDHSRSTIYSINTSTGNIVHKTVVKGEIGDAVYYHNKWYLYSSLVDEDYIQYDEKLSSYDFSNGTVSFISDVDTMSWLILHSVNIEVGCGYIWVYWVGGGDGRYFGFVDRVKIPKG